VYIIRSPFQLTGLYFVGHVWWLCVLRGASSCVSVSVDGVRGGRADRCVWVCGVCVLHSGVFAIH
jgi:hypothetical protein